MSLWASTLLALAMALPAQQATNDLAISVLIRTDSATGTGYGTAGSDRGEDVATRVTATADFCTTGTGDWALTQPHEFSWELSGRVVSRTSDTVTAEVTWKQLEGAGTGSPARSRTVTLHNGERAVLETVPLTGPQKCAREARLEVEAGPRIRGIRLAPGTSQRIDTGGRPAGGGGTRGAGAMAGSTSTSGSGVAAGASGGAGGRGFSMREPVDAELALPSGAPITVEIWLIRTLSNGTERVEAHDRAENVALVAKKFGPLSAVTPKGNVSITVGLNLRTLARQKETLFISVNRDVSAGAAVDHGGVARIAEVPGAAEIISLELPQGRDVVDRFSIRLRFSKPSLQQPRQ